MKKYYTTILCAFISHSFFAQTIKEVGDGIYFRQTAEGIDVVQSRANRGFNNPNEVVVIQDSYGNRYWTIADGTVVKFEKSADIDNTKQDIKQDIKIEKVIPATKVEPTAPKKIEEEIVVQQEEVPVQQNEEEETLSPTEQIPTETTVPENIIENAEKQPETSNPIDTEVQIEEEAINNANDPKIDVSELFEERFENLPKKERKERERNEKKIRKELEKELKSYRKKNK